MCRSNCTVCSWKASLQNGLACVSWGHQLLWRNSCIVCKRMASLHYEQVLSQISSTDAWVAALVAFVSLFSHHAEACVFLGLWPSQRRNCNEHMRKICLQSAFPWYVLSSDCVVLINLGSSGIREACPCQNGWIFGKVPKGVGGVISNPKIFVANFGLLNRVFLA